MALIELSDINKTYNNAISTKPTTTDSPCMS